MKGLVVRIEGSDLVDLWSERTVETVCSVLDESLGSADAEQRIREAYARLRPAIETLPDFDEEVDGEGRFRELVLEIAADEAAGPIELVSFEDVVVALSEDQLKDFAPSVEL